MKLAERFASEAEKLRGTPFRLLGRDPSTGLDCIGLATCALERAGGSARAPSAYRLRNLDIGDFIGCAPRSGLRGARGPVLRGDLVLTRPGPAQHHLLVSLGEALFVHAHAGLGRVVIQPLREDWPILHHWRLSAD